MRWKFVRVFINERFVQYRYSRETDDLDGIIQYDKKTEDIIIIKPCENDKGSELSQSIAKEHFYWNVIQEGLPESRYVACG